MITVLYTFTNSSAIQTERLQDGAYLESNAAGTLMFVMAEDGRAIAAFPVSNVLSATYRAEGPRTPGARRTGSGGDAAVSR